MQHLLPLSTLQTRALSRLLHQLLASAECEGTPEEMEPFTESEMELLLPLLGELEGELERSTAADRGEAARGSPAFTA